MLILKLMLKSIRKSFRRLINKPARPHEAEAKSQLSNCTYNFFILNNIFSHKFNTLVWIAVVTIDLAITWGVDV